MSRSGILRQALAALFLTGVAGSALATDVAVCTSAGRFVITLADEQAPQHTASFLNYTDSGFFIGTVFHRVIEDFMIQGGGYDRDLLPRRPGDPIRNESNNGLSNQRATIAAARTSDPDSASAQFFINLVDNSRLDGSADPDGYTVFGTVTAGMDVVDAIAGLPTGAVGPFPTDVPTPLISIEHVARVRGSTVTDPEQAAALRTQISSAYDAGDYPAALEWIAEYYAGCPGTDPRFLYEEAVSAAETGRMTWASNALEEYFRTAAQNDALRAAATELLASLSPEVTAKLVNRAADCAEPAIPPVPDGTRADLDTMMASQAAIRDFMRLSTEYLECLDEYIDNDGLAVNLRQAALGEYNAMVDLTQTLGDRFNAQVRAYRARQ